MECHAQGHVVLECTVVDSHSRALLQPHMLLYTEYCSKWSSITTHCHMQELFPQRMPKISYDIAVVINTQDYFCFASYEAVHGFIHFF